MKKLFVGLLAAFLMSAGLVAATSTAPASAVCGNPQYPACFNTITGLLVADDPSGVRRFEFTAGVIAEGTNAKPTGTFKFRFKRVGAASPRFATRTVSEDGVAQLTRRLRKGTWNISVTYIPRERTIFQGSKSDTTQIQVG